MFDKEVEEKINNLKDVTIKKVGEFTVIENKNPVKLQRTTCSSIISCGGPNEPSLPPIIGRPNDTVPPISGGPNDPDVPEW